MLRGHVFKKQLFSNNCFALFIDTFLDGGSGVVNGCALSNTAGSISIDNGYFCVRGRFLQEEGGTIINVSPAAEETYCILVCEIDLSKENTASSLNQAYYEIIQGASDYPELIQQDIILDTSGKYQFEFARFKLNGTGITNFQDTRQFLDFDSIYGEIRRDKDYFFEVLSRTTKAEADYLIEQLEAYIETVKHVLDEDTAMHLLNMINLKADKKKSWSRLLTVDGWSETAPYTQTLQLDSALATDIINMYPVYSDNVDTRAIEKDQYSKISIVETSEGQAVVTCDEEKPSVDLNVRLEVYY